MSEALNLDEIEALAAAATSDPWVVDHNRDGEAWLRFPAGGWISAEWRWEHDAQFTAAARTAVPALVARVRALEAEVRRLRGIAHEGLAWAAAFVEGESQRACVQALQRQLD